MTLAQDNSTRYPTIADKTRAEYMGQLKGILEYSYSNGFITTDIASHIEIPNTTQSKAIERLPFSTDDLRKMFPGDKYREDFSIHKSGIDPAAKFWFPLMAAFSGVRLEELGQLNVSDIRTCPETGIIYAMIDNEGVVADGHKKHTKNLNSVRPIPIHSKLIQMGFMDYLKEREADTANGMLFKLARDKQGRVGKSVSNWFSRMEKCKNGVPIIGYIEGRGVDSKGKNAAGER